jgi:DNA-directed RNA polymerase subunit RPC12/RpoP
MLKCPDCDHIYESGDGITLYQCGNCDTTFSQNGSADGAGHQCPDCHKFAAKLGENGCPECEEVEGEDIMAFEKDGAWVEDEETEAPKAEATGEGDDEDDAYLASLPRIPTVRVCPNCNHRHEHPVPKCVKCGWEAYNPLPHLDRQVMPTP